MTDRDNNPREPANGPLPDSPPSADVQQPDVGLEAQFAERQHAEQNLRHAHEQLEQRAAQLQRLAAELIQVEQRERRRLAHILHDHLQQLLVGARFHLGVLHGQPPGPQQEQSLHQVEDLLDQSLNASRGLAMELSPPILYEGTFLQVMHWLARWVRDKYKLDAELEVDDLPDPQAEEIRLLLFQSVRELLLNVVKHAGVSRATIRVSREGTDRIRASVSDEGGRLCPAAAEPSQAAGRRLRPVQHPGAA